MAGTKATEAQKAEIRDLCKQGYNIDDMMARYPLLDGRVIGGIYQRFKLTQGAPEGGAPAAATPAPRVVQGNDSPGVKTVGVESQEKLGFTPLSESTNNPGGFKPAYREYFIIKKLDPPNDGIKGTEYPPFTVVELMDRYPSGDYEVQHYREGKLFQTYRERVSVGSSRNGGSSAPVTVERKVELSPADMFLKAMDVTHRLHSEAKGEASAVRREEIQATVVKEQAKAQVETAAMVGLMDIVKEQTRPKADAMGPHLETLMRMTAEQNSASIERHKRDMEELRTRQKHEADLERERLKSERDMERERILSDREKFQEEMRQRQADRDAFLTKMSEIEEKRDEFHRESYERMITEIGTTREAAEAEIRERKESAKELIEVQKKFNDEMIALKKTMGGPDKDLEVAKIIKDGITGGLDRIGHRVDLLVKTGAIGDKGPQKVETAAPKPHATEAASAPAATHAKEEKKAVFTDDEAKNELKSPWFQQLKGEIVQTIRMRKTGRKLHGAMLGQVFIDNLNHGKVTVAHLHWICARVWKKRSNDPLDPPGILDVAVDAITPEEMKILDTEDGDLWFSEYVYFLSEAYNSSIPGVSGH